MSVARFANLFKDREVDIWLVCLRDIYKISAIERKWEESVKPYLVHVACLY